MLNSFRIKLLMLLPRPEERFGLRKQQLYVSVNTLCCGSAHRTNVLSFQPSHKAVQVELMLAFNYQCNILLWNIQFIQTNGTWLINFSFCWCYWVSEIKMKSPLFFGLLPIFADEGINSSSDVCVELFQANRFHQDNIWLIRDYWFLQTQIFHVTSFLCLQTPISMWHHNVMMSHWH